MEGRTQKVVVEGASSDPSPVKSGVPQGSVLGPLLFLLFINDLAEQTSSTMRLFADDCVMYKSVKTIQDCEVLQNDLDQLHQWEKRWQLRFNASKCNIMRATHAKKKQLLYEYKLGGEALLPTNSTAYLGVELSSDLKWNTHVRKTASKANQTLGVLRRNLKNCPREIKNMAYKSILRPKMEYAAPIWDPYCIQRTTFNSWKQFSVEQPVLYATSTADIRVSQACCRTRIGHCWNRDEQNPA